MRSPTSELVRTPLWTKQMSGAISDLSISKSGNAILVATSPDPDIIGSVNHYLLSKYGQGGKVIWQLKQSSPVKEAALSEDGSFVVVSNYDNQLFALDAGGKKSWSIDGMCKPILSSFNKKIICYHDDDNEPKTAFDVYDWTGKKISSHAISKDVLAMKLSHDEQSLVMAQTGGFVVLFAADYAPLWTKSIPGEVVDVSVSDKPSPVVAVLYREKNNAKIPRIAIFRSGLDANGTTVKTLSPSVNANQIELSSDGKFVFYYGDTSSGQNLGGLSISSSQELWKYGGKIPMEYNSSISVASKKVFMGFQENGQGQRRSHVLGFSFGGELIADIRLPVDSSAYLYNFKIATSADLMAVGIDDGKLSVFRY